MSGRFTVKCPICSNQFDTDVFIKNEDNEVFVYCSQCQHKIILKIILEQPRETTTHNQENTCPKCGTIRKNQDDACPKCGLIYEKWNGGLEPFEQYSDLRKDWQKLQDLDIKSEQHDLFLEKCFNQGLLGEAARAYRMIAQNRKTDVSARLRQIRILAQMAIPIDSKKNKNSSNWIYIFIMLVFGLFFLWVMSQIS